jgi:cell wall-associated NlpC family hydrolase
MKTQKDTNPLVRAYTPAWRPPNASLAGMVVVIDPAGGGSDSDDGRRVDDLAVMTGAVLFHFVQQAGGIPIMTRADDNPAIQRAELREGQFIATEQSNRDHTSPSSSTITVSIAFELTDSDSGTAIAVQPTSADSSGEQLATALREAMSCVSSHQPTVAPHACKKGSPSCLITFQLAAPIVRTQRAPRIPREAAARICRGLIAFQSANTESKVFAQPTSPYPKPVPRFVDRAPEQELRETARRIWPHGVLPSEYASWYCEMFARSVLSDRTFVYFQPAVSLRNDEVHVSGATNVALLRDTMSSALHCVGVERVVNEMRLLPEEGTLGQARFGICTSSMALTYAEPSESAGMRSQLLEGEPLYLLDRDAGFLLVHGHDGYWGWVRESSVKTLSDSYAGQRSFSELQREPSSGSEGAAKRVAAALELLHVPYVFGGVSPIGLDCSGLVQRVFGRSGIVMARDAAQQFVIGELVATRWHRESIEAGDLLFFINRCGRIFHVGIAISPKHFVHSGPPEVKINSLDPDDPHYAPDRAETFLAARRLM